MTRPTSRTVKVPIRWMLLAIIWPYYAIGFLIMGTVPIPLLLVTGALVAWELRGRLPIAVRVWLADKLAWVAVLAIIAVIALAIGWAVADGLLWSDCLDDPTRVSCD